MNNDIRVLYFAGIGDKDYEASEGSGGGWKIKPRLQNRGSVLHCDMGESKKRSQKKGSGASSETSGNPIPSFTQERLHQLSALQILDLVGFKLNANGISLTEIGYLRQRIEEMEVLTDEARVAIEKLEEIVKKLRSPAFRVGTFLMPVEPETAHVCVGGSDYVCRLDPKVPLNSLQVGQRVLCNEAYAVVQSLGFDRNGPIVKIDELLSEGRLRIGQETGMGNSVVLRSSLLAKEKLKQGMEVRLDANQRVALEVIGVGKRIERSLETIQAVPWSTIGGQDDAVQAIRDTIEMPFLHKELFQRFEHRVPKGFLLYGPPGCGKTLLGKATAYNLRQQLLQQTGVDHPEFFLHVKGPEILNMWVGESERQVRDLFAQCRERAQDGALAFLFIDEAESILGTRRGGRFNSILSTLVPMFCAEMDGINPLSNVVVILASNRADLIDPAILRPGRIDRKIRVTRPDEAGAKRIYEIYLKSSLPLEENSEEMSARISKHHFAKSSENRFLEIFYKSGKKDFLYRGDLASGAIIAAVVERAKNFAIKRSIATGKETAISMEDLKQAVETEYAENDLFPPGDITEDWLRLTDFSPENVIKLSPVRKKEESISTGIV
ncbi:MAG: spoVK [Verrucomicrobiales bacterium]|nr:spoVK [Verrucomicrobiales bacterium]